ncbi:hypothetical protein GW17_00043069 [Ensete ventricosum]|nr:hypothetical protein GW17_00043069 [Ensete ventricosum]
MLNQISLQCVYWIHKMIKHNNSQQNHHRYTCFKDLHARFHYKSCCIFFVCSIKFHYTVLIGYKN